MYLGCSSESYSRALGAGRLTLGDFIGICGEELGLRAVELEDAHIGNPTPSRLAELRAAAARHRLEIVDIALMNNFGVADDGSAATRKPGRRGGWARPTSSGAGSSGPSRAGRRASARRAGRACWAPCAAWCAPPRRPTCSWSWRITTTAVSSRRPTTCWRSSTRCPSPALALLLDTGNYVDGLASIRRTAGLARHVHAKFREVGPDGRDRLVDHEAVVGELRRVGYQGCLSIEYEGEEPSESAVPRAVAYMRRLLEG
jgi:sugar phosphate isomerase/epimerase